MMKALPLFGALALLGALAPSALAADPEAARGLTWRHDRLDPALEEGAAARQLILVKADASWCPECKKLEAEVFATAEGAAIAERLVPARLDFDLEDNRPAMQRYVILGLPTTLVLRPDGTEVGRITGYGGAEKFLAQLKTLESEGDPMPGLRAAAEARPDDAEAALRYGEALLVRNDRRGEATLERALWLAGESQPAIAAEALFLLGRYHHRVRRDPGTARHVWRELATRFPTEGWAGGAWVWYARAHDELGTPETGAAALRARALAQPGNVAAARQWLSFVAERPELPGRDAEVTALRRHVAVLARRGPDARDLVEAARSL